MRKILTIAATLMSFAFTATATTNITGQIRTNTTWTKAGSPYVLSNLVEVNPNVTLTIEPGATIKCNNPIVVYGAINATGTASDPIKFIDYDTEKIKMLSSILIKEHQAGQELINFEYCSFDKVRFSAEDYINIHLNHCNFSWGTLYFNGEHTDVHIQNTIISDGSVILSAADTCIIADNEINSGYADLKKCNYVEVVNCKVSKQTFGISVSNSKKALVKDNIVTLTETHAIHVYSQLDPNSIVVTGNIIANNKKRGLLVSDVNGLIENNSIYNNEVGVVYNDIYGSANVAIENNCIYSNKVYDMSNISDRSIHVGTNWWGTLDSSSIEYNIQDSMDYYTTGRVSFTPILTQQPGNCKTATPPTNLTEKKITKSNMLVYPNPFTSELQLAVDGNKHIQDVAVFDISGRKIYHATEVQARQTTINTATFAPGMYLYKVTMDDNTIVTGKITK